MKILFFVCLDNETISIPTNMLLLILLVRNRVFATNSDFLIPISVQSDVVWPFIFKIINFVRSNSLSLKYHRFMPSGSKDIGIRKFSLTYETGPAFRCCLSYCSAHSYNLLFFSPVYRDFNAAKYFF